MGGGRAEVESKNGRSDGAPWHFGELAHLVAALSMTPYQFENRCLVALPLLAVVIVVTVMFFVVGMLKNHLPESQRRRTQMMSHGSSLIGGESTWGGVSSSVEH